MDKTQLGRAGELAVALYSMVTSDGDLELFAPVADDDHIDATAFLGDRSPRSLVGARAGKDSCKCSDGRLSDLVSMRTGAAAPALVQRLR